VSARSPGSHHEEENKVPRTRHHRGAIGPHTAESVMATLTKAKREAFTLRRQCRFLDVNPERSMLITIAPEAGFAGNRTHWPGPMSRNGCLWQLRASPGQRNPSLPVRVTTTG
jgi:hypothetical protein